MKDIMKKRYSGWGMAVAGLSVGSLLTSAMLPALCEAGQPQEWKGKIAKSYEDSEEWWAPEVRPPEGSPNVSIFLLDDVGFAQVGSFGGLIDTPNIDKLAANGLRFNNFHTTALSSTFTRHPDGWAQSSLHWFG